MKKEIDTLAQFTNVFVGYNEVEDFTICILALDAIEAKEIVDGYQNDTRLSGNFEISQYDGSIQRFDCDYIIC